MHEELQYSRYMQASVMDAADVEAPLDFGCATQMLRVRLYLPCPAVLLQGRFTITRPARSAPALKAVPAICKKLTVQTRWLRPAVLVHAKLSQPCVFAPGHARA